MPYSSPANIPPRRQLSGGFTLIEMLVIAPIAVLIIAGFIALMVSMAGSVMTTRDETKMTYDSQSALNAIEQDARLSLQFMTATTGVQSPQGVGSNFSGTGDFANGSNTLILKVLATDKNPADVTRQLVYYANQPNACGANQAANQIFIFTVVYFIKDGSLWRRSIVPPNNTSATADINTVCSAPWQLNSCSPGYSASLCKTNDIQLMQNVTNLDVAYYSSPSSTTPLPSADAPSATTIKVSLTGAKKTAGRDISSTQGLVATKVNDTSQNTGPTPLAIAQQPTNKSVPNGATNVTFTSSSNFGNASIQWQRSTNGGSTWSNVAGATTTTLTLASVTTTMNNYQYRMIATAYGSSVTSNAAILSVN